MCPAYSPLPINPSVIGHCSKCLRKFRSHHGGKWVHHLDSKQCVSLLIRCKSLNQVRMIHAQVVASEWLRDNHLTNRILREYCRHGALGEAYRLFERIPRRDEITWSTMVGGFTAMGEYESSFSVFRELVRLGLSPDSYTLPCVMRVCRITDNPRAGRCMHGVAYKSGMNQNHYVSVALIEMYGKCHAAEDVRKLFDGMLRKDLVSWTVAIDAYAECDLPSESLALFERMKDGGVATDRVAMVTLAFACAKLGDRHRATQVHEYILSRGFALDVVLGTAMIDMHSKCGCVESAREVFECMKDKNVYSWSAMIAAYGYHGEGRKALDLLTSMQENGVSPNGVTFLSLLYACSHAGLVDEGRRLLSVMRDDYGTDPDVKHYACMVDLLGRAGKLDEALELIKSSGFSTDVGLWGALLSACRIHGHISVDVENAFSALETRLPSAGHHVLLSNIYAVKEKWSDVARIREEMVAKRLKKNPGWAWIVVGDETRRFGVGDVTHPELRHVLHLLHCLKTHTDHRTHLCV